MSITRTLVAALAVMALAVPAAQARPADMHASVAQANAKAQQQEQQRLDSPHGIDAPRLRGHAAAAAVKAPGATAVDSATQPGPPTWPVNPQPISSAPTVKAVDDGGTDWMPVALGIAGGLLAIGAVALLATRRRTRVPLAS
jgi:uncharacterized protein YcnI